MFLLKYVAFTFQYELKNKIFLAYLKFFGKSLTSNICLKQNDAQLEKEVLGSDKFSNDFNGKLTRMKKVSQYLLQSKLENTLFLHFSEKSSCNCVGH